MDVDVTEPSSSPGLADVVRRVAREHPNHPYLHYGDATVTYAELDERSNTVATSLRKLGVGAGDRVALLDKNSPVCFEVMFAAAKCGAVFVPINWRLAHPEVRQILEDSEARVLVVGQEFTQCIEDPQCPSGLETIIVIGQHPTHKSYDAWAAEAEPSDPFVAQAPGFASLIVYTSGTTARPKGVMLTNDNLLAKLGESARIWGYDSDSVNLVVMPLFHIGGIGTMLLGVLHGATTVLTREVNPAQILELIPAYRVTNTLLAPAIIQMLLDTPGSELIDWSRLRTMMYGTAPMSDSLLLRAMKTMGCRFIQLYGITEHSGCVTWLMPEDHDPVNNPALLRSCGRKLPWVDIQITDPDTHNPLSAGEVGEIWVRSVQVMKGYWRQPEATANVMVEGWLRTGDAGRLDEHGYLYLHDRVKDMIISGGENVFPAEIENVVMEHPAVAEVAVIGVPHPRWGETPLAVVVVRNGTSVSANEIIAFTRERLAAYKCPSRVELADALPRNAAGKVLKRELREPHWQGLDRRIS